MCLVFINYAESQYTCSFIGCGWTLSTVTPTIQTAKPFRHSNGGLFIRWFWWCVEWPLDKCSKFGRLTFEPDNQVFSKKEESYFSFKSESFSLKLAKRLELTITWCGVYWKASGDKIKSNHNRWIKIESQPPQEWNDSTSSVKPTSINEKNFEHYSELERCCYW